MCIDMHENDTIKEANCIWVIRKSIGLYAENDAEVINIMIYSQLCKDEETQSIWELEARKGWWKQTSFNSKIGVLMPLYFGL